MKKKLYMNTLLSLLYQIVAIVNGLIVPRFILSIFGSSVNGLTSSITQMLSIISFLDLGVGSVVQVGLYAPLAKRDDKKISEVYACSVQYFNKIAYVLIAYIGVLCIYYSYGKDTEFSSIYSVTLILAISISMLAQYLWGINNTLLLNADQRIYIVTILNIVSTIINAIVVISCLKMSMSIQVVKLASSLVFLIKPLYMEFYVKRHYNIVRIKKPPKDTLKNKWSGMIQHITTAVSNNIDYFIMTFLADLNMISVYAVYVLPLNCIKQLIESLTTSYKSFFGNLLATKKMELLVIEFRKFELLFHFLVVVVFSTLVHVLIPFVLLYTNGIKDVDYNNNVFCICILLAYAFYCLRIPYTTIIFAAGHFKETQRYCIVEVFLNVIISVCLFGKLNIAGIAIGTFVSAGYRMIASAYYLKDNILKRSFLPWIKQLTVDIVAVILTSIVLSKIEINNENFYLFILTCVFPFFISVLITSAVFSIFLHSEFNILIREWISKLNKK